MSPDPAPPPPPDPQPAPSLDNASSDELIDEGLHETFPASDPVSTTAAERAEVAEADRQRRESGEQVVDLSPPAPPDGPLFPTSDNPPEGS